ncbi:hypothetical protein BH23ACT3_BH23ACT3_01040 [soil metagenome]
MSDHPSTDPHDVTDGGDPSRAASDGVVRRRILGLAGAGVATAAVTLAGGGRVSAADGDTVLVGNDHDGDTATTFENTTAVSPIAGPHSALVGFINSPDNGSHTINAFTSGNGHAVAGETLKRENSVGATWGRHGGLGAGAEGVNIAPDVPLAGPAHGVKGLITDQTNGSHAVIGITQGAGHSVAGDTPAEANGGANTTAATWGRHGGPGAGIGGVSAMGYGGEFVGGKASVRLIPTDGVPAGPPSDAGHLRGELYVDGSGDLWYNVSDGANWVRLNTGGTVILPDPQRAFDSRPPSNPQSGPKGRFDAGGTRLIDLTESTDLPVGASAIINLTVTDTGPWGFLTLYNGDSSTRPDTSSINWSTPGSSVANSVHVATGAAGTIQVYAFESTHVIVDVLGFLT